MSAETVLEVQTRALLHRLEREQGLRTRRAQEDAAEQARDIARRARSEARARVHQAVLDTRREIESAIARRTAAIETRRRSARQATLRRLLDDAWQRLPAALEARWEQPDARATWCRSACAQATRSLLRTERVVVELDPRWRDELAPVAQAALCAGGVIEVEAVDGLGAGLRLRGGRACIDATVRGLVAARERVAAELLAEADRQLTDGARGEVIA